MVPHKKYEELKYSVLKQIQYMKELSEPFARIEIPLQWEELAIYTRALRCLTNVTATTDHEHSKLDVQCLNLHGRKLISTWNQYGSMLSAMKQMNKSVSAYKIPEL